PKWIPPFSSIGNRSRTNPSQNGQPGWTRRRNGSVVLPKWDVRTTLTTMPTPQDRFTPLTQ
ncbi:hypothetical protein BG000_006378, partial [Podila horticola]